MEVWRKLTPLAQAYRRSRRSTSKRIPFQSRGFALSFIHRQVDQKISREWTQTGPTTYERAIDHLETYYLFMADRGSGQPRQNWYTTAAIKIKTEREDFSKDIKNVWTALRYEHPNYSAFVQNDRWIYNVADEQELGSWLQETFHIHDVEESARQLYPFKTNPSQRAVLHVLPRTQEIVLQAPHTHVDGIGMVTFFNQMMQLLVAPPARPNFGKEGSHLVPPISKTAEIPEYTISQKVAWDAALVKFRSQFPTVSLRPDNAGALPAKYTKLQWLTFTAEETARIAAKSKELGFSVTAAAQAALSHATRVHSQVRNKTHSTLAIFDAREHINPNLHPPHKLVGPHVFAMPVVIPVTSFVETARQTKKVFIDCKKDDLVRAVSPLFSSDLIATLSAPRPPQMRISGQLQLTSLGILDKHLNTVYRSSEQKSGGRTQLEVQDLWLAPDMLTPDITADVWTFRGQLHIQLAYNGAFYHDESVAFLLRLIQKQFAQGLSLDLETDIKVPGDESFLKTQKEVASLAGHA
ncbi:hypothetical protein MGYG_04005 [Nannizzia gypsea CBS 118893]|uniref:Condensation domain-containing protein n=1 Tax=Arthroderma gypseum (strain ATCC MYA-4604 / CBS 118893) TaxID=535722 RepID=E4UUN6_ARTGP|nr:hypothetical protein MGYG_04005 [Nannizzia gypsea CBS 118893]EFR01003.1 hypothetical protein MGYG_04005 [Nannizzia gypsea CBS 118893]